MIAIIHRAMKRRRLNVAQLASSAKLSSSYLYDVLSAQKRLSTRAALLLAGPLGVSARALLVAQLDDDLAAAAAGTQQEAGQ